MAEDQLSSSAKPSSSRVRVHAEITVEDAERLRRAFAEGKLKELGITQITIGGEAISGATGFSKREDAKRGKSDKSIDPT